MVGIALSYTTVGIDAMEVTVECDRTGHQNARALGHAFILGSREPRFAAIRNSNSSDRGATRQFAPADQERFFILDLPIVIYVLTTM